MDWIELFHNLGALFTFLFGVTSLAIPDRVAKVAFFSLKGARGKAEMRIAFGGFFVALGAFVLYRQSLVLFTALGVAWLGLAITRVAVWFLDKPKWNRSYTFFLLFEAGTATALLI